MRTRYVLWSTLWHVIREDAVFLTRCGRKAPPRSRWSDARPNGVLCRQCEAAS